MVTTHAVSLKAKLFRGLADPSRLSILDVLRAGEKMVSDIVSATGLSQPNVSGHLNCLKDCGLVVSRQDGRRVFYALGDPRMETLIEAAEHIIAGVSERISCCSNYECKTSQKCVSDKKCASPRRASPPVLTRSAIKIPLAEISLLERSSR